jgi:predicted transcriptional regulator
MPNASGKSLEYSTYWGLKMDIIETPVKNEEMLIGLTADVVAAYVSNNPVPVGELPNLIADVHAALGRVGGAPEQVSVDKQKPAVNPKKSVHDDYIICLEDGKKFKSLKRHLMTHYGLSPDQYREKWGLDATYPMVAPNYAAARSQLAKKMGLGRKRSGK